MAAPDAPPITEPAAADAKRCRRQMTDVLGLNIPPARIRAHLASVVISPRVAMLRDQLSKYDAGSAEYNDTSKLIAALVGGQPRIAGDLGAAIAAIVNYTLLEQLRMAIYQASTEHHNVVAVAHLHSGYARQLPSWPILMMSKLYRAYSPETEKTACLRQTEMNNAIRLARQAAKAAAGGTVETVETVETADTADTAAATFKPFATGETTFDSYINAVINTIKEMDGAASKFKISARIRTYCSTLIIEITRKFGDLLLVLFNGTQRKMRTFDAVAAVMLTKLQLTLYNVDPAAYKVIFDYVESKLECLCRHVESDKLRREAELSDEKRAKRDADAAVLQRQQVVARRDRAVAAARAKALEAKALSDTLKGMPAVE